MPGKKSNDMNNNAEEYEDGLPPQGTMYFFEKRGDPIESLQAYKHLWDPNHKGKNNTNTNTNNTDRDRDGDDNDNTTINKTQKTPLSLDHKISMDHNRSVLLNLAINEKHARLYPHTKKLTKQEQRKQLLLQDFRPSSSASALSNSTSPDIDTDTDTPTSETTNTTTQSLLTQLIHIHHQQVTYILKQNPNYLTHEQQMKTIDAHTTLVLLQRQDSTQSSSGSYTFDVMFQSNPYHDNELSTQAFQYHYQLLNDSFFNGNKFAEWMIPFQIISHNLALIFLSSGKPLQALHILVTIFDQYIRNDSSTTTSTTASASASVEDDENDTDIYFAEKEYKHFIHCRIIFLILDALLTLYKGDPLGLPNPLFPDILLASPPSTSDEHQHEHQHEHDHDLTNTNTNTNINTNTNSSHSVLNSMSPFTVDDLFAWVESHVEQYTTDPPSTDHISNLLEDEYPNEIKFRLHLYKARFLFLSRPSFVSTMKQDVNVNVNVRLRQCKKEMKSAMEIFQHKLRTALEERAYSNMNGNNNSNSNNNVTSVSVGSNSAPDPATSTNAQQQQQQQQQQQHSSNNSNEHEHHHHSYGSMSVSSPKLDIQNQCALYLKANLESLKTNYKKSIVLCNEAHLHFSGSGYRDDNVNVTLERNQKTDTKYDKFDENQNHTNTNTNTNLDDNEFEDISRQDDLDCAIHFSNLGCVLQSTGRLHMALLYYSRALNLIDKLSFAQTAAAVATAPNNHTHNNYKDFFFTPEGLVRPIPVCEILHNAALCALQMKNWSMAYEYMCKCVKGSPNVFAKRPRCWLRMAESCIGIHEIKKKSLPCEYDVKVIGGLLGISSRLVVDHKHFRTTSPDITQQLSQDFGSTHDLLLVLENPLPRALSCLRIALTLCNNQSQSNANANPTSTDYDCIEATRLSIAYVMLELNDPMESLQMAKRVYEKNGYEEGTINNRDNIASRILSRQRIATARLYACEAFCKVGNFKEAISALCDSQLDADDEEEEVVSEFKKETEAFLYTLNKLAYSLAGVKEGTLLQWSEEKTDDNDNPTPPVFNEAVSSLNVSASGLMASIDDVDAAEMHAKIALKSLSLIKDKSYDFARTATSVKKALLCCYLYKGDTSNAVEILQSLR